MGILVYAYFLILGFLYADYIFKGKDLYYKIYSGAVLGNIILMSGIIPFAFIFRFTILSHILLIIIAAVPYALLIHRRSKTKEIEGNAVYEKLFFKSNKKLLVKGVVDNKILLFVILPISIITWVLLTNHIMVPYSGGGIASGQSTYGDLAMHMGFVTSIAEQGTFPPVYNVLAGTKLCYPFLIDSLSSSIYLFGTSLRLSILIPSYVFAAIIVYGFYNLASSMTNNKAASILATYLFFIGGGFGFAYFLEGAKENPENFTQIFTEYYKTPTNLNDSNIRWANPICDMIIPQRTTMAGWGVILFALERLIYAAKDNKRTSFILLGIVAGCMPMIHTHSFLALAVISAVMAVWSIVQTPEKDRKYSLINWCIYAAIAAVLALPQLFIWTFTQVGGDSFLRYTFNWVNEKDPYLWFWLKNCGIVTLLIIPAFINTSKDNKKIFTGGILLFIIAEFLLFQPNPYDNNKLFFIVYMMAVILISEFSVNIYDKLKDIKWRGYFAALLIVFGTLSGALTIIREFNSGGEYQTFSENDIKFSEFVKDNTDPTATFATTSEHLNPVSVLAGRNIYVGSSLYVYFHGLGNDMYDRNDQMKDLYSSNSQSELLNMANELNIRYIVIGPKEKNEFQINQNAFNGLNEIYSENGYILYDLGE